MVRKVLLLHLRLEAFQDRSLAIHVACSLAQKGHRLFLEPIIAALGSGVGT